MSDQCIQNIISCNPILRVASQWIKPLRFTKAKTIGVCRSSQEAQNQPWKNVSMDIRGRKGIQLWHIYSNSGRHYISRVAKSTRGLGKLKRRKKLYFKEMMTTRGWFLFSFWRYKQELAIAVVVYWNATPYLLTKSIIAMLAMKSKC